MGNFAFIYILVYNNHRIAIQYIVIEEDNGWVLLQRNAMIYNARICSLQVLLCKTRGK